MSRLDSHAVDLHGCVVVQRCDARGRRQEQQVEVREQIGDELVDAVARIERRQVLFERRLLRLQQTDDTG